MRDISWTSYGLSMNQHSPARLCQREENNNNMEGNYSQHLETPAVNPELESRVWVEAHPRDNDWTLRMTVVAAASPNRRVATPDNEADCPSHELCWHYYPDWPSILISMSANTYSSASESIIPTPSRLHDRVPDRIPRRTPWRTVAWYQKEKPSTCFPDRIQEEIRERKKLRGYYWATVSHLRISKFVLVDFESVDKLSYCYVLREFCPSSHSQRCFVAFFHLDARYLESWARSWLTLLYDTRWPRSLGLGTCCGTTKVANMCLKALTVTR